MSNTLRVISEVAKERDRQRELAHGGDTDKFDEYNSPNDWVGYICAYAGRAAFKVAKNERQGENFRENMIKVAALAVAAVEAYDNQAPHELPE